MNEKNGMKFDFANRAILKNARDKDIDDKKYFISSTGEKVLNTVQARVDDIKKRYPHIESGTKPEKVKENIDKERP